MENSKLPFIVQGQINNTINEQNVQGVSLNSQNENVKDISFSNSGDSKIKIRPEPPKVVYKMVSIDKSKVGVNLTAIPSVHDEIGSIRQIIDDRYTIIRDGKIIKENIIPELDFTDTDIKYGNVYNYVVRVTSKDGLFNDSPQISISTIDSTIPHEPYDFTIVADGSSDIQNGKVSIRFKQNNDEDYYGMRILSKQSDLAETEWKEIKFFPKVGSDYILDNGYVRCALPNIMFGKYYDFAIQAADWFGNLSAQKIIRSYFISDNTAPNPVNNFNASSIYESPLKIRLSWQKPDSVDGVSDIAGYKIERTEITSTGIPSYSDITTINDDDIVAYDDNSSITSGKTYIYRIRAFDSNGNFSDYSYSNKALVDVAISTINVSISHQYSGELTFPATITVSSLTEDHGHDFAIALYKKSNGEQISRQIITGTQLNATFFSVGMNYNDLTQKFINSLSNETFGNNAFQIKIYKRVISGASLASLIEIGSTNVTLDFRPPQVQNFVVSYDPKNKKMYLKWDAVSFSILYGYEIRYSGKVTSKTWDLSTPVKTIVANTISDTIIDIPSDIDLSIASQEVFFSIKAISNFSLSPLMLSNDRTLSSVIAYGKLPAITGTSVTGDIQSVIIKFTPLDLSIYKGVKEYWIYASYTEPDLNNPTDQMIAWKGQASMPVINKMPDGNIIPNEIRTIYFRMAAVDFYGTIGTLSDIFSGQSHDGNIPEYTVSFSPNILVDRLLSQDSLQVTISSYDNSGFLATGALYVSIDDGEFISKTYTLSNEDKNLSYQETFSSLSSGQHKISFKIFDKYNNMASSQIYNFEVDISVPSALPAPYILKDNSFVQMMQIALSGKTFLPLTGIKDSIDIFNSKTVQVCLPSFTTCSNFSHIKLYISEYNISTSSYGEYIEIKMPQSANLPSSTVISDFKATVTFSEDMPDFKIKAIQVKKNGILGDINSAIASTKNKIDTTAPLIKLNSIRYENDTTLENIANSNFINSRILNGGLIIDLTIIETNSGLWSNAVDVENLRMPVYYQINGGQKLPLLEYGSSMFKSPFYIPKEQFSSFNEGDKVTITIYALDNALKVGDFKITKVINKIAPADISSQKAIFGIESNKPVIKVLYTKPSDSDLAGIRLYENGVLLKETLGEVMSIPTPDTGADRTFVLKSVDEANNQSSGITLVAHNYAPAQVTNFTLQQEINGLTLSWLPVTKDTNNDDMTDLKYYEVTYTKYNETVVAKSLTNRFNILLTKDEISYYNSNPAIDITAIKVRAVDFYGAVGAYSEERHGRPRFIEAVDMTDNIFNFVATSNKFTGTFSYILDGNFKNSENISSSVVKDDYIQVDMPKPDYISDIKLKFSSSSDVIKFIIGYYYVAPSGTKEWRYLSSADGSHSSSNIVDRGSYIETAHTNYIEVPVPDGTDIGGTYLISMLKSTLSKQVLYCSAIKLIFSSALASVGVSEIQPRLRSIYNEFYGEILYLSNMASIRSSEDATNFLNFDKEKISVFGNSEEKVRLGLLSDGSYGLWAKDNVYLGGSDVATANSRFDSSTIGLGYISSNTYNLNITSNEIGIGFIKTDSTHYGYNTKLTSGAISLGYDANYDVYGLVMDYSLPDDFDRYFLIRSPRIGHPDLLKVFCPESNSIPTIWGNSFCSSEDVSDISFSDVQINRVTIRNKTTYARGCLFADQQYVGVTAISANAVENGTALSGYIAPQYFGYAVYGRADAGYGVYGKTNTSYGVFGEATSGKAIYGISSTNYGVHGKSGTIGIYGESTGTSAGVSGYSASGYGIVANSGGATSLYSQKGSQFDGDVKCGAQIYAESMDSGAGDYAIKWSLASGKFTKDTSSIRYKHDIERLSFDINLYNAIMPSKFKYNSDNSNDIGFIAEEMATIFPDIVIFDKSGRPDAIKYDRISAYNVLANQYNNKRIQELEKQISDLKLLVDTLINK